MINNSNTETQKKVSGFTLVELIISVAVMTILAGMAAQTFRVVLDARDLAIKRLEVSETARSALDYIGTDLRSAYLTPDSVKPVDPTSSGRGVNDGPRFRFAGIYRDAEVSVEEGTPGAGIDDDGDGEIDEEILDGLDDDLDCLEDGDHTCIDEDIGIYPSDILHFVSAIESSGDIILQEISYGLDPSGTKLIRRAQILSLNNNASQLEELVDFGQFVDNTTRKRLLPLPVAPGTLVSQSQVREAIDNWDHGSKYGTLQNVNSPVTNKNPGKMFQVLAYDVRGLRFRYGYYDYNRGGWRWTKEWDSAQETALIPPNRNLFTQPAANDSLEGNRKTSFANLIVNEPSDMYPRMQGVGTQFLITDPGVLRPGSQYEALRNKIISRTDGLPNVVEITIYVQDRDQDINPKAFTTRVFIPNNYRSIGLS